MRRAAVAPDFEIVQKIEIMCMISFFLPDLGLSVVGTPELRIVAPEGWGMTLTQKSRMRRAPELRIVSPCAWFRCVLKLHPNQFEEDQVWLEEDQSQPETGYPTLYPLYGEINPMAFRS